MNLPLKGVTVVAVEQAVAAPFATRHLADLGARVIKIERTAGGDFARQYDDKVEGMSSHFAWLNRNKESLAVDLRSEQGRELLGRLLTTADVFLYNLAPGAMARLGFGREELRAQFPRLIVAELTGYGSEGPLRGLKAYDMLIQAEAGLVSITGGPDTPSKAGIPVADIAAGAYLVQGVLAALLQRQGSDEGRIVEVSLFDSLVEWMSYPLYFASYGGSAPERMGLAHPTVVPYDAYTTADGDSVIIAIQNDAGWHALARHVLMAPELAQDPRFATNVVRSAHRQEVDKLVSKRTRELTTAELGDLLEKAGIAHGQVKEVADVADHVQLVERNRWASVDSPVGNVRALLPPLAPVSWPARMEAIPALGEHSDAILDELGYDDTERDGLRRSGVVA